MENLVIFRPYGRITAAEGSIYPYQHPINWQSPLKDMRPPNLLVCDYACDEFFDYAAGLNLVWPIPADLLIIEQDNIPTKEAILELVKCPARLCVPMYRLWPIRTGLPEPVWAHRRPGKKDFLEFIPKWQEWVPFAGLGFAKISAEIKAFYPPPNEITHWKEVDTAMSQIFSENGLQWHVHKIEVEHLETIPIAEQEFASAAITLL